MSNSDLTGKIIGAAIEVHRNLGPGLLESTYEACLAYELELIGLAVKSQVEVPINYRGKHLQQGYRLDLLVENEVVVKIKAVETILDIHKAQLLTYLKLTGLRVGLRMNVNVVQLSQGIKRLVNHLDQ